MEKHEVVIVGAGPGGLKAAQTLAKYGKKDTLVLEALPEKKMGSIIASGGLALNTLTIFNIPKEITETPLNGAVIYWADKSSSKLVFNSPPVCHMWLRKNFYKWLVEQTRKMGVEVRPNSKVVKLNREENWIELESGEKISYNYLIGADGAKSIIRRELKLKTRAVSVMEIEVPISPSEIPNGGKDIAHVYLSFNHLGHGFSLYIPYTDIISFELLSIDSEFISNNEKMKRFKEFVKEVDIIDLEGYEFRAQAVCYKPVGLKHGNIYLVGDAGGWGELIGGMFYAAAKTGKIAAEDICGISIKEEFREFNAWNRRYQFAGKSIQWYDAHIPTRIKKRLSRFIIDTVAPRLVKTRFIKDFVWPSVYPKVLKIMLSPLPGDEE